MEVIPYSQFVLKLTEKEFKLLGLCVAHCAGIKEAKPNQAEANQLNLLLTKSYLLFHEEKTVAAKKTFDKAVANPVPDPNLSVSGGVDE